MSSVAFDERHGERHGPACEHLPLPHAACAESDLLSRHRAIKGGDRPRQRISSMFFTHGRRHHGTCCNGGDERICARMRPPGHRYESREPKVKLQALNAQTNVSQRAGPLLRDRMVCPLVTAAAHLRAVNKADVLHVTIVHRLPGQPCDWSVAQSADFQSFGLLFVPLSLGRASRGRAATGSFRTRQFAVILAPPQCRLPNRLTGTVMRSWIWTKSMTICWLGWWCVASYDPPRFGRTDCICHTCRAHARPSRSVYANFGSGRATVGRN